MSNITEIKKYINSDGVQAKFKELLGNKAASFVTSVMQAVTANPKLAECEPTTVYGAAAVAAILNLQIDPNLGFAYIVPYKGRAQFQMGYKGFIQLAQRTGLFQTIADTPIYEGQLISENPLTGFVFDFTKKPESTIPIGYAAYFRLLNGFEKTLYMSVDEVRKHGEKYSKSFKFPNGLWNTDFDAMARKTVTKMLLSRYAPLSVEMSNAIRYDQGQINGETMETTYIDSTDVTTQEDKVEERITLMIGDATTLEELQTCLEDAKQHDLLVVWEAKHEQLSNQIKTA